MQGEGISPGVTLAMAAKYSARVHARICVMAPPLEWPCVCVCVCVIFLRGECVCVCDIFGGKCVGVHGEGISPGGGAGDGREVLGVGAGEDCVMAPPLEWALF